MELPTENTKQSRGVTVALGILIPSDKVRILARLSSRCEASGYFVWFCRMFAPIGSSVELPIGNAK